MQIPYIACFLSPCVSSASVGCVPFPSVRVLHHSWWPHTTLFSNSFPLWMLFTFLEVLYHLFPLLSNISCSSVYIFTEILGKLDFSVRYCGPFCFQRTRADSWHQCDQYMYIYISVIFTPLPLSLWLYLYLFTIISLHHVSTRHLVLWLMYTAFSGRVTWTNKQVYVVLVIFVYTCLVQKEKLCFSFCLKHFKWFLI